MNNYISFEYKDGTIVSVREDNLGLIELGNGYLYLSVRNDKYLSKVDIPISELKYVFYEGPHELYIISEIRKRIYNG